MLKFTECRLQTRPLAAVGLISVKVSISEYLRCHFIYQNLVTLLRQFYTFSTQHNRENGLIKQTYEKNIQFSINQLYRWSISNSTTFSIASMTTITIKVSLHTRINQCHVLQDSHATFSSKYIISWHILVAGGMKLINILQLHLCC